MFDLRTGKEWMIGIIFHSFGAVFKWSTALGFAQWDIKKIKMTDKNTCTVVRNYGQVVLVLMEVTARTFDMFE